MGVKHLNYSSQRRQRISSLDVRSQRGFVDETYSLAATMAFTGLFPGAYREASDACDKWSALDVKSNTNVSIHKSEIIKRQKPRLKI